VPGYLTPHENFRQNPVLQPPLIDENKLRLEVAEQAGKTLNRSVSAAKRASSTPTSAVLQFGYAGLEAQSN
jgi:hypothetical protein